jgi:hypothetical protein
MRASSFAMDPARPPNAIAIPIDLANEIGAYLGRLPHDEVVGMIARMKKGTLCHIEAPKPAQRPANPLTAVENPPEPAAAPPANDAEAPASPAS